MIENYAQVNSEYLKRRYKRRHENPEKIKELMADATSTVENLRTAAEGKMDAAAVGVLHTILVAIEAGSGNYVDSVEQSYGQQTQGKEKEYVEDAGDRQRALFKANICPTIVSVMRQLGGHAGVCEKALGCVAYLCRYSEEYKQSVCLENAKAFGLCGISDLIVSAIKQHNNSKNVLSAACDAVRSICSLASNRDRLGAAGACETLARALIKYMNNPELICWLCRAIGHLSNGNGNNIEILGANGACENIILALQKYPANLQVCIECCYAIRNLALSAGNRGRLVRDFAPESILAVFKNHYADEVFSIEACHAIVNMIGSETDELIFRVASGGFISYSIRSVKKNPDSEVLVRWAFQGLYYVACDERMCSKLITSEILDTLSVSLENHASEENMAEWGCRFVEKILAQSSPHTLEITEKDSGKDKEDHAEGESKESKPAKDIVKVVNKGSQALYLATCAKLRTAGMCEMITSAVQRQAISAIVASIGALCIGQLARDNNNQSRLSSAGACEAVVTALKRHSKHADVCTNACYAIYYLCKSINNISWMGAYGACEAVCTALKEFSSDPNVVRYATLAVAALAYKDEGNLERLRQRDINSILVSACSPHIDNNYFIAENMCHAISNLCLENANVSDLGKHGACGLVVNILYLYANMHTVVTQALIAIAALAVRQKTDKVHKGNTRKLVEKGALEVTMAVMQKFMEYDDVQRAGGLAITALARLEGNKLKLSALNACELVSNAIQTHMANPLVIVKLIYAVEALTHFCEPNIGKLVSLNIVGILLQALNKHENVYYVVECIFKALINISLYNKVTYQNAFTEAACKLYIKALKLHEKHARVAKWGCHFIYVATAAPHMQLHPVTAHKEVHSPNDGSEKDHKAKAKNHKDQHKVDKHEDDSEKAKKLEQRSDTIPPAAISEVRKLFGQMTKAPETLVSIMIKYINSPEDKEHKDEGQKEGKDSHMSNMHSLHNYQTATHIEVLIYTSMAVYTLNLLELNKKKFIDQDINAALLKTIQQHYKEDCLCEWLLMNLNSSLFTNHNEKVRLGQQHIMPSVFNILNTYSHDTNENSTNIIKLACESTYELCLVPYNQQELVGMKDGAATIVDVMIGLINLYKDNLDLIIVIIKAISAICINNSSAKTKNSKSQSLFGMGQQANSNAPPNEHIVANMFTDSGLADLLVKLLDQHQDSAPLVQWVCATVVSLCTKNSKVQILFVSHFQLITKLTPLLVQHKNALPCVTQITRCLRSLVLNVADHTTLVTGSPIILPTVLELLQLHPNSDNLVEHACFLLGSIEYKPSRALWNKLQSAFGSVRKASQEDVEHVAATPQRSSSYTSELFNNPAAFQTPSTPGPSTHQQLPFMTPQTPGVSGVTSAKAFYTSMVNYDLLFSVLQTHLNKNGQLNSNNISAPNAPKSSNNGMVIRSICMAITMFAEKGKLHHYNICNTLYAVLSKESMLNNTDEHLIQKILLCIGALCKNNEQNNSLLTETNSLIDEVDIYIHEYKESNIVLYGVFVALIGICEYNLSMNQNKINGCNNIIPCLIKIMYNDLETDFISQLGCVIITLLTKNHLKNKLKLHSVSNFIADVILTHKQNTSIVLDCLKATSSLAHKCISNRNRLGTSEACQIVCGVFTPQVLEDELLNSAAFLHFPNNTFYYGVRCIGELAANHANNCAKLGASGACEALVTMLNRPTQSPGQIFMLIFWYRQPLTFPPYLLIGEYLTEMKFFSLLYWALANLLVPTKEAPVAQEPAATSAHRNSVVSVTSNKTAAIGAIGAVGGAINMNLNLSGLTAKPVKNTTRLFNLSAADALVRTLERALTPPSSTPLPFVTLQWGARLLVCLAKSQKLKTQVIDCGGRELAMRMVEALTALEAKGEIKEETGEQGEGGDVKEAKEWAQMAVDSLNDSDIPLH